MLFKEFSQTLDNEKRRTRGPRFTKPTLEVTDTVIKMTGQPCLKESCIQFKIELARLVGLYADGMRLFLPPPLYIMTTIANFQ